MDYNQRIWLVVYRRKNVFDFLLISQNSVQKYDKSNNNNKVGKTIAKFNRRGCDAYLASAYVVTMTMSETFRKSAFGALLRFCKSRKLYGNVFIMIKLLTPKYQFLDYKWNERINTMIIERQNIEYAMSWLSTLGGAFSSLGDSFEHCAEMAGKISIEQFKLALQLGDPILVARCKLYAALSLIQRNHLNYPKIIIQEVFAFARKVNDVRLQRMSQGIWVKLRYHRYLRKLKKKKCKSFDEVK